MRSTSRLLRWLRLSLPLAVPWMAGSPACAQQVTIAPRSKIGPLTQEQEQTLAGVRNYVENYVRNLPDYLCVQTTKRDFQPAALNSWPSGDEIREVITFSGHRETYEVQSVNGKPVHLKRSELGGNISSGEFGTWLERIFDPASRAEFTYQRRTTLRGVPVDVFTYRVSRDHGYTLQSGPPLQEYVSAWEGLIYAERATGAVLRIRMECTGIPAGFPVRNLNLTLDYNHVKIGDREYILPFHLELREQSVRGETRNVADYRSYRKFETDTTFSPVEP